MEKSLFKKWLLGLRVGWEGSQPGAKIQPVLRLGMKNREDRAQIHMEILAKYLGRSKGNVCPKA